MPTLPRAGLRDTLTVVLAGGQGERLYPLTRDRTKPAVPFGGAYRIIDFTLSNCLNSGLRRIYVLTQYKSLSLDRHVRGGWHIFNEGIGEFIVPIPPQRRDWRLVVQGTADAIFQNTYTLERERPELVVILSGDHIYKADYGRMVAFHREKGADLTVACIEVGSPEASDFGIAGVDEDGRIVRWREKPTDPDPIPGTTDRFLASMGVYVFNTEVLVRRVSQDAKRSTDHDFGKDVIPAMVDRDRMFAYPFRDENPGKAAYWRDIGRLGAYYDANMDLLRPDPEFVLHDPRWPIRTNPRHAPPVKTLTGDDEGLPGQARDSMVAAGTIIHGGDVRNSVLGYGVRVREGAKVEESILFDDVDVGPGARLRRVISDKRVKIPAGVVIGHDPEDDARRFTVTSSGLVVLPKEMEL